MSHTQRKHPAHHSSSSVSYGVLLTSFINVIIRENIFIAAYIKCSANRDYVDYVYETILDYAHNMEKWFLRSADINVCRCSSKSHTLGHSLMNEFFITIHFSRLKPSNCHMHISRTHICSQHNLLRERRTWYRAKLRKTTSEAPNGLVRPTRASLQIF